MDFSLSKNIQNFGNHLYDSGHPFYSNKPSINYINPGLNISLYNDIVPILSGFERHATQPKLEKSDGPNNETKDMMDNNQTGAGEEDDLIKRSFEHPRPIKTEMITVTNKALKRHLNEPSKTIKKAKQVVHKFQLV